jgi:hypothetical protein
MTTLKAKAGHVHYEVDGPPRFIVADVFDGQAVILMVDHPDDTLAGMQEEARRIRASRRTGAHRLHSQPK